MKNNHCNEKKILSNQLFIKRLFFNQHNTVNKDDYIFNLPAVKAIKNDENGLIFKQPVTFVVGENGSGKSTLLEAIAVHQGFNAEGGTKNFNFNTKDTHSNLHDCIKISKSGIFPDNSFFLRAESFYNFASELERLDEISPLLKYYGGKSLHKQSHGESFFSTILNRFGNNGLYILDEPEAALSPMRQLSLISLIDELVKNNSQFIIATHSPILLTYPRAEIFLLEKNEIKKVKYNETDHYKITLDYLNCPERYLKHLI